MNALQPLSAEPTAIITTAAPTELTSFLDHSAPGQQLSRRDDAVKSDPELAALVQQADAWKLTPGDPAEANHSFYDFAKASELSDGDFALTPTITSYYGHEVIPPAGIDLIEIKRHHKVRLVAVSLLRVSPGHTCRVLGWQGDNDTIHLLTPLPGEDEYLGVYHAIVFGKRAADDVRREEQRAHYLRSLEHGHTAVLDSDVRLLETEFAPAVMQSHQPAMQA